MPTADGCLFAICRVGWVSWFDAEISKTGFDTFLFFSLQKQHADECRWMDAYAACRVG